jgi:hypothetical protein
VHLGYGGTWVEIAPDLKRFAVGRVGRPATHGMIEPPLESPADRLPVRLVVKGGVRALFAGGRKVVEERLPAEPDPWLSVVADGAVSGGVRGLTLSGRPAVPDRLALSAASDLTGWHADDYDEPLSGERPAWEKRGEEIYGRAYEPGVPGNRATPLPAPAAPGAFSVAGGAGASEFVTGVPGSLQESVLRYHRPVLEDGEVSYEFYFEPGKTMVHPALGRLAFLLDPEGVTVHRLTDAQYETSGLAPDNAPAGPSGRRGAGRLPLKPHDWNRLALGVAGDVVTLVLNGETVFEGRPGPTPPDRRSFGLFHYADRTDVRVRGVTYRGAWPRALPSPSALAGEPEPGPGR